jgi:hypothetical protein
LGDFRGDFTCPVSGPSPDDEGPETSLPDLRLIGRWQRKEEKMSEEKHRYLKVRNQPELLEAVSKIR